MVINRYNSVNFVTCVNRDVLVVMPSGIHFRKSAVLTDETQSPSVECHVAGTAVTDVNTKHSFCLEWRSVVSLKLLDMITRDQLNSRFHGRDIFREIGLLP